MSPVFIGGIPVYITDGSLYWIGPATVDADGALRAYHPDSHSGLDALANAGKHGHWYGLVCDENGQPVVQGPDDPAPGFYVSPTSLADPNRLVIDPFRYVDASAVPYIAVPPELRALGVKFGDVGMMVRRGTGGCTAVIVADGGPHNKIGEVSIACADRLTFPSSPREGGLGGHNLLTVVFPNTFTMPRWPRSEEDIAEQAAELFGTWGGLTRALALLL